MNEMLKRLMQRARLMAPADENGQAGGADDDFEVQYEDEEESGEQKQEEVKEVKETEPKVADDEHKDPVVHDDEEEDEDAPEGETEEQKRERRRKERQDRKARQKEREESTKRELAAIRREKQELEQRLASLEGRDRSREIAQVDETIKRANNAYDHWKNKLAEAMEQHDGAAAAVATEKMLEAREASTKLNTFKQNYEKSQATPKQNLDPEMVSHAQKFMGDHKWYKHGGSDTDSRIVMQLDQTLAEEGRNPSTEEYWEELRARVKKYLPHRVAGGKVSTSDDKPVPRTQKAVVGGGGGETTASGGKQIFKLSKERVQALKDAGQWNDPKLREAAIKSYREYDKANKKG